MTMQPTLTEPPSKQDRLVTKIEYELGETVRQALADEDVTEIMLNADGTLWTESRSQGMTRVGVMSEVDAKTLIGSIAHSLNEVVHSNDPIVEGTLPGYGSRFEGLLPPVVASPIWVIRKRAGRIFTLDDMLSQGVIKPSQQDELKQAIQTKKNILIAGGTGSGKTTFLNSLVHEITVQYPDERLLIIEDTPEIRCSADNAVLLEATRHVSMNELLKATLRLRPDRILVGEVRGQEALTLLKSWNTGHPGGIATVHASSAPGALLRIQQLAAEAQGPTFDDLEPMVQQTVEVVAVIERQPGGSRCMNELITL